MFEVLRRSAIARLLAAMVVGGLVGAFAPECVIRALNSFAGTFSQFVKFIVPLIIFGLVTPAIADAGRRAGRMLLLTVVLAYVSTILAGMFGFCLADVVFPRILSGSVAAAESAKTLPAYFTLTIPPVMGVVTAMALAFVLGLAMSTMECPTLTRLFSELKEVVALAIGKAIVPPDGLLLQPPLAGQAPPQELARARPYARRTLSDVLVRQARQLLRRLKNMKQGGRR